MNVGILGMGAYALSLSDILIYNKCNVMMWSKFQEEKDNLEINRGNDKVLPNYKIDSSIKLTCDLKEIIEFSDLLVIVIIAGGVRELVNEMMPYINNNNIVIATKGIEQKTGAFMSDIVSKLNTKNISVLSGGTFAIDMVKKEPLGLSISGTIYDEVKRAFENDYVKLEYIQNNKSLEILGSIKNVIAISSGILTGLQVNETTKNTFLTMAILDMQKILEVFDCDKLDILSFAGIGDLLLTCSSTTSRNFTYGKLIGENKDYNNYSNNTTVEGLYTLMSIHMLLHEKHVNINIIELIYDIVVNKKDSRSILEFINN